MGGRDHVAVRTHSNCGCKKWVRRERFTASVLRLRLGLGLRVTPANGAIAREALSPAFSPRLPSPSGHTQSGKKRSAGFPGLIVAFSDNYALGSDRRGSRGDAMEKRWWCVSCFTQIDLDRHGRCSICGSDAVDRIVRGASAMDALEKIPAQSKSLWGFSLKFLRTKLTGHWTGKNASLLQQSSWSKRV